MKRINGIGRLAAFVVMTFFIATIFLPNTARADKRTDQAMQTIIEQRLQDHGLKNIQVTVNNGAIALTGSVATMDEKVKAENYARKVGENYTIADNITLIPLTMSDQELLDNVVEKIKKNVFYSIYDWVTINVNNGVVTLQGWVYEPWHKPLFEHQAEKVAGVTQVNNDIQVLPVSLFDDAIRRRAAAIIYGSSDFEPYSNVMNPPIHIIVDNSKVILEGFVTSKYQRDVADNLITVDTNALQVVNNLQIIP